MKLYTHIVCPRIVDVHTSRILEAWKSKEGTVVDGAVIDNRYTRWCSVRCLNSSLWPRRASSSLTAFDIERNFYTRVQWVCGASVPARERHPQESFSVSHAASTVVGEKTRRRRRRRLHLRKCCCYVRARESFESVSRRRRCVAKRALRHNLFSCREKCLHSRLRLREESAESFHGRPRERECQQSYLGRGD